MATKGADVPTTKASTGIPAIDALSNGGLPRGRATLTRGHAGSGKTVLALQNLVNGVRDFGEPASSSRSKRIPGGLSPTPSRSAGIYRRSNATGFSSSMRSRGHHPNGANRLGGLLATLDSKVDNWAPGGSFSTPSMWSWRC